MRSWIDCWSSSPSHRNMPRDPARRAVEATRKGWVTECANRDSPRRERRRSGSQWRQRLPALRSRSGPRPCHARTGCRPVSGLAGLDRLPSRAIAQWRHEAVHTGLPLRGQPRHTRKVSRSPRSRFIGDDEFAADTCSRQFTALCAKKTLTRRVEPSSSRKRRFSGRCCYNSRPRLTSQAWLASFISGRSAAR